MLGQNMDAGFSPNLGDTRHTLLIVSQVRLFSESIAEAIEGNPNLTVVGLAADTGEALSALRAHPSATVLIDAAFPRGLEALRAIRDADPSTPIIVFALVETEDNIIPWVKGGATGYIPSTASIHAVSQMSTPSSAASRSVRAPSRPG
ncbi:response regulator [Roseiarcus sp.]|uniref:response regulator n=1 Tax=Roseiarcus sp. TaxID=1969460 RepID=UPI003F99EFFF